MNETLNTLVSRKSCRSYQKEHLSREIIDQILTAGLKAPSGMNRQTARFVVVQDDATVQHLSQMNAKVGSIASDPFYGAPDVIVVLAKKEGTYVSDGALAMGNLLNAAWSMGLGCCWINRAKEVFETEEGQALLRTWGVTEDVAGIAFCILGHVQTEKEPSVIKPDRIFYV